MSDLPIDAIQQVFDGYSSATPTLNGAMVYIAADNQLQALLDENKWLQVDRDEWREQAYWTRPCLMFRPRLFIDGNQWCALLGDNLQEGVAGFGNSPEKAMYAFDGAWTTPLPTELAVESQCVVEPGKPFPPQSVIRLLRKLYDLAYVEMARSQTAPVLEAITEIESHYNTKVGKGINNE